MLLVLGAGFGGLLAFWALLWHQLQPVTDPARWDAVRSEVTGLGEGLVDHFPAPIPEDAGAPRLFFRRGFLQGGMTVQLRLALPEPRLRAEAERFRAMGLPALPDPQPPPVLLAPTTADGSFERHPDDFEIFVIDADPGTSSPWNHGRLRGASISLARREIVYWAERW